MLAIGKPEFPSRVVAIGTKNVHSDKNTPDSRERDVPEHIELLAEFPSGVSLMLAVGWARIMRHAHWPSDVLGGFLLGIGCAAAAAWWASSHAEAAAESQRVGDPEAPRQMMPTTSQS